MLRPRIIPCLLIKDGGLVKSVQFKNYKYIGDPINAVRIFNEKESDELMVIDIDATKENLGFKGIDTSRANLILNESERVLGCYDCWQIL
jgi:imidazole glycerol phosphate synthase subunit HisF